MIGKIVAISGQKCVKVAVVSVVVHPLYKKTRKVVKNYLCHVELDGAKVGCTVELKPCRPMSAKKRFLVVGIVDVKNG